MVEEMWKFLAVGVVVSVTVRSQNAPANPVVPPPVVKMGTSVPAQEPAMTSIERQRQSIERQKQSLRENYPQVYREVRLTPAPATFAPPGDCPPMAPADVKAIIDREANRHKMDPRLIQAVVETESAYLPCAVSPVGALGLMQLMPATAESLRVSNPFDPDENITAGTQFLKQMLERYGGDVAKSLAAYNAGPARVDANGGIPPIAETQEYVRKIMGKIGPVSAPAQ